MSSFPLYFGTSLTWLNVIRNWASSHDEIAVVWIYGSRAKGVRREKPNPSPDPDLDLAVALTGSTIGERTADWISESDGWLAELSSSLPVKVDLRLHDKDTADNIPIWVSDHGVEIFNRDKA